MYIQQDPEDAELTDDQDTSHTGDDSVSPGGAQDDTENNPPSQKVSENKPVQNNQVPVCAPFITIVGLFFITIKSI